MDHSDTSFIHSAFWVKRSVSAGPGKDMGSAMGETGEAVGGLKARTLTTEDRGKNLEKRGMGGAIPS